MTEVQSTREQLLRLLLEEKAGRTIEELADALGVSRNAVRQHLASLATEDLVAAKDVRRTIGRPSRLFALTQRGEQQFPKQYALLARHLLTSLHEAVGAAGTARVMATVAESMEHDLAPHVHGNTAAERAADVVRTMNDLHYEAHLESAGEELSIVANNCVYHDLASQFPEVCTFDVNLITSLLRSPVDHTECMAKGGHVCRFVVKPV